MKYYIHNLAKNTYFVAKSFDEMIQWFARHNTPKYEEIRFGSYSWMRKQKALPIDPKIHRYQDYNSALREVAMNPNEHYSQWGYDYQGRKYCDIHHRTILVKDEMDRTIDPRHYWDIIATTEVRYTYRSRRSWLRRDMSWIYRYDPVPLTRKHRGGGGWYRHPKTTQERRLAADPEIKQYVKPKRNIANLPNTWDDIHRHKDRCWKNKKIEKQWMKHIKGRFVWQ